MRRGLGRLYLERGRITQLTTPACKILRNAIASDAIAPDDICVTVPLLEVIDRPVRLPALVAITDAGVSPLGDRSGPRKGKRCHMVARRNRLDWKKLAVPLIQIAAAAVEVMRRAGLLY